MERLKSVEEGIDRDEEFKKIKDGEHFSQLLEYEELYPHVKYPGNFPVRILMKQFSLYFNNYSKSIENTLNDIKKFKVADKITWTTNDIGIPFPYCSRQNNGNWQIQVSETFLTYLWCISYFFFLQLERKAQQDNTNTYDPVYLITDAMITRSETLLQWALSLKTEISPWDEQLPSPLPTALLIDSEPAYCWQVSETSCYALVFTLFHELSHGVLKVDLSDNLKRQEQDADNLAMDFMREPRSYIPRDHTILGILLSLTCPLLVLDSPKNLASKTHPDPDIRIVNVLDYLVEKTDEKYESYQFLVVLVFRTFCLLHKINDRTVLDGGRKSPQQMVDEYLEIFNSFK